VKGVDKGRFVDLHGQGKKMCRLVSGGMLICVSDALLMADVSKLLSMSSP